MNLDYLSIYYGDDIEVNEHVKIHIPTLKEIKCFGEKRYFSFLTTFCSTPSDLMWQLWDVGIDYTKIDNYDLFIEFLAKNIKLEDSRLIFGDELDFSKMSVVYDDKKKMNVLLLSVHKEELVDIDEVTKQQYIKYKKPIPTVCSDYEIVIDRYMYEYMVSHLRFIHGLEENIQNPLNEATKMNLIEDAKDDYLIQKDKPFKSNLLPLISGLVNSSNIGRNDRTVFEMNIFSFLDSVKRITKIKNADLLLQSAYSGFGVKLKDIKNKKDLDWLGDIHTKDE